METVDKIAHELKDYPMLMSLGQFSKATGFSRATGYRLIDTGELESRYIKLTGKDRSAVRVTRESVAKLLQGWWEGK
jgi:predicted DNA-binding transcriptional regulator AlpA